MKFVSLTIILLLCGFYSISQPQLDTLIRKRTLDTIGGKLPTYYSAGNKRVALDIRKNMTSAIDYYEKKYHKSFHVKLAVLDSLDWLTERIPYGFVFYDSGWMVMNTGMQYSTFKKVYGLESFSDQLDKELKRHNIKPDEMIRAFYSFYSIHELGHYFIDCLSNATAPDSWMGEVIATYFSYEYYKNKQPNTLIPFELFSGIDKNYYKPVHTSIKDFDEIYGAMGIKNYLWYHSNFYFLAKSLYGCKGKTFISFFEDSFPKTSTTKFSTHDIIQILDKDCHSITMHWVEQLQQKRN